MGMVGAFPICAYFHYNPIQLGENIGKMVEEYGMEAVLQASIQPSVFIQQAVTPELLRHFIDICYADSSARTLSYLRKIMAAVSFIYDIGVKKAAIKTCEILAGPEKAKALAGKLEPKEISDIRNQIDYITSITNFDQITAQIEVIKNAAKEVSKLSTVSLADITELAADLNKTLAAHPVYNAGKEAINDAMSSTSTQVAWKASPVSSDPF